MIGKAFFDNLADSANPVFIKEMRQYFQNSRMLLFIGGLLLAEFVCTLFFSASLSGEDSDSGTIFFLLIVTAGAILSVLICAVGAELRFSEERSDKELNYAMLTTLKPSSIILGKLEGSLVMTLCIFSLLLPFLAAAYFMRGLSLASLLIVLLIIPTILMNSLLGILAGSFGKRWVTVLYFMAILNSLFGLVPIGFQVVSELMESAATEPEFWIMLGVEYGITTLVGILLFLLAVAVVAPPKSNRLLPVKVYLFILPFFTLAVMLSLFFLLGGHSGSWFPKEALYIIECLFSSGAFLVILAIALFEQPAAGIRVYMKCPRNFFGRCLHFVFSTGFPGSVILAIPLMLIPAALAPLMRFTHSENTAVFGFQCMLVTFFGAALLSLIIAWRTKLPLPAWVWMIIFLGAGTIAPLPFLIDERFENLADSFRALLMAISPIQALVEIFEGRAPTRGGLAVSAFTALFLFCVLLPVILKSFALHHRPSESEAVKPPTPEMLKK